MSAVRVPAVSGLFYNADPAQLSAEIDQMLSDAELGGAAELSFNPLALVVPHAGYIYSGFVAAAAYVTLIPLAETIHTVVILGPSHRVPLRGMAVPSSESFMTPLGTVKVDQSKVDKVSRFSGVIKTDLAHQYEHCLEVQLPFLQKVLPDFSIVPVVVGESERQDVARLIAFFLGQPGVLVVISTDLSHYHTYEEANHIDSETSDCILAMNACLAGEQACGCYALNGLLEAAKQKQLRCELLALANSGDSAGDHLRVVGYGAYALG